MDDKIVLLGAPGSGKGTQAKRLCDELNLTLISTGDLLRSAVREGTPLGVKAKEYMDAGKLVPDELVIGLIEEKLKNINSGVLLDGFPRNIKQAEMLDTITQVTIAVDLNVPEEVIVDRIVKRRSCKDCNEVYHLDAKPPGEDGKCSKCGGDLYQRSDDTEEVVRNRLKVYKESTLPLTQFYKGRGVLIEVDGKGDIDEVYTRMVNAIRDFKQ